MSKADEMMLGTKQNEADEMFKALGYNKKQVTDEFIVYSKKELRNKREWEICINFNCYDKYLMTKNKQYFCLEELQAINEKVKELRMDIEEAKDILLNVVADEVVGAYCIEIQKETDCAKNCENDDCFIIRAIETVLKELELKDKVINEMSKSFVTHMIGIAQEYSVDANFLEKEKLIEYFTNKVKLQSNKQSQ